MIVGEKSLLFLTKDIFNMAYKIFFENVISMTELGKTNPAHIYSISSSKFGTKETREGHLKNTKMTRTK